LDKLSTSEHLISLPKIGMIFSVQFQGRNTVAGCIAFYAVVEMVSYYRFRQRVHAVDVQPPLGPSCKFDPIYWKNWFYKEMIAQPCPKDFVERVFQAPQHEIARERAVHWLCFYLTGRELESYDDRCYPSSVIDMAEDILNKMEEKGEFKLHSDPALAWLPKSAPMSPHSKVPDFARVGRGPINAFYKPLLVQAVVCFSRMYAEHELRDMGFLRTVDHNNVVFWVRRPVDDHEHDKFHDCVRPLFFMHGLGFGVVPYIHFVRALLDDSRTVVVPEWPNISLGWSDNQKFSGLLPDEYADSISNMVDKLQNSDGSPAKTIDVIGHSYVSESILV
jgi:hypothetical protein